MIINILHLSHRHDREKSVIQQMEEQGAAYMFWEGEMTPERKVGISRSHKKIIQYAKDMNMPMCCVAEDDVKFTHKNSYNYFLNNIPNSFDLYLSGVYSGQPDANGIVKKFSGLTLYICAQKYYDTFLSVTEKQHIDTALGLVGGKFVVAPQMCATQFSGYSDQRKRYADDSRRIRDKILYNG